MINIPAGPELDRLVAEKVMWWSWVKTHVPAGVNAFYDWQEASDYEGPDRRGKGFCSPWHPSTNIAHAWEVVERMESLGYEFFAGHSVRQSSGKYFVQFTATTPVNGPREYVEKEASTMPLAICRAALAAMGVK